MTSSNGIISINEKTFIRQSIIDGTRLDGRGRYDHRPITMQFLEGDGGSNSVDLRLGTTRVMASVSSTVVPPDAGRPTEGFYFFDTQVSPLSSEAALTSTNKSKPRIVETGRILEKGLKNSKAIDTEALCIVAHEKVLAVRTDIRLLDDGGNFTGAASIAGITALKRFRRPVAANNNSNDQAPLPLHHIPIAITFGVFEGGSMIVDPTWKEEQVMDGVVSITMNKHGEICMLQKCGGIPLEPEQLVEMAKIASLKSVELNEMISSYFPE